MMRLDEELSRRLQELHALGLYRSVREVSSAQSTRLRVEGQDLINFSSNDYLGLADHRALKAAAQKALQDFGVGCVRMHVRERMSVCR